MIDDSTLSDDSVLPADLDIASDNEEDLLGDRDIDLDSDDLVLDDDPANWN